MNSFFTSRRSEVSSRFGVCSSSQPLASAAGVRILEAGGNAADACVAMAAALNVLEPCSTGIGGDAFALYYDQQSRRVSCLAGNGGTSRHLTLEYLQQKNVLVEGLSPRSGLCVTVPGAAALWADLVERHGKKKLDGVLQPAIHMAKMGVPIGPITAHAWGKGFLQGEEAVSVFGHPCPKPSQLFTNPKLASTFESIATHGAREGFYRGRIAAEIVAAVQKYGGTLDLEDLAAHRTAFVDPISADFRGYRVYQVPPPTHGIAVLGALKLIEKLSPSAELFSRESRKDVEQLHVSIEAMRLAMADALQYVGDHGGTSGSSQEWSALLSDAYVTHRSQLIEPHRSIAVQPGDPTPFLQSDTVYFGCIDGKGNACSMINSNYMGFGTGISPIGTGFTLHNRGYNFSLVPGHPNQIGPGKKPYHTIIPALITRPHKTSGMPSRNDEVLFAVLGNMGGFMQPMGHVQLIRNLIDFKLSPQEAVDAPRWYLDGAGETQSSKDVEKSRVKLEVGYGGLGETSLPVSDGTSAVDLGEKLSEALRAKGHHVAPLVCGFDRLLFGKAQVLVWDSQSGVATAGSDPRGDGAAVPALFSNN